MIRVSLPLCNFTKTYPFVGLHFNDKYKAKIVKIIVSGILEADGVLATLLFLSWPGTEIFDQQEAIYWFGSEHALHMADKSYFTKVALMMYLTVQPKMDAYRTVSVVMKIYQDFVTDIMYTYQIIFCQQTCLFSMFLASFVWSIGAVFRGRVSRNIFYKQLNDMQQLLRRPGVATYAL